MAKQILPNTPFDGQIFVDAFRVEWVYNSENDTWTKIGVVSDVPIARSEDNELGPTNGLFSARDKLMLDNLKDKPGGFGFVLKPGYYLTEDGAADNVISGDVQFVSETLKFDCTTSNPTGVVGFNTPTVKIGLSTDFLEAYRLELQGPKGKTGVDGSEGLAGRPGTGDGPQGDAGADGTDAVAHAFTGIIYEELDEIFNSAVVNMRLDAPNGILEVTKALMDVPGNDKAATRVAASPVIRDIEFTSSDFDDWQLVAPLDDPASTTDLNVIKLPKGWTGDADVAVPITSVKLSSMVGSLVEFFDTEATKVIENWDQALKDWVVGRDTAAREALQLLAKDLAECEFRLPLEFCIGIEPGECTILPGAALGVVVMIVFIDESSPYQTTTTYNEDLLRYFNLVNLHTGTLFSTVVTSAFQPQSSSGQTVIPAGTTPTGFTIHVIDRPPQAADLAALYTSFGVEADNIYLLVDNSGSMTTSDIEPGYSNFAAWLRNNTAANVVESTFAHERWLQVLADHVEILAATTPPLSPDFEGGI